MTTLDSWWWFMCAVVLGITSTWLTRGAARRAGIVAEPNPIIPQHQVATAYLGGVGVGLAAGATLLLAAVSNSEVSSGTAELLIPAVLFLGVGLYDDLRPLSAPAKLTLQTGIAILAVLLGLSSPWTGLMGFDAGLSVLWIVVIVNAVNLTDVCDGLVGGIAAVSLMGAALLVPAVALPAAAVAGACVGFLVWNKPAASVFLGDAGSHLLGFALAAVGITLVTESPGWRSAAGALFLAGVPVFELVFISTIRIRKGLPWWKGSPDHFSLRMQEGGLTRWQTDLLAWSATALLVGAAAALRRLASIGGFVILLGAAACVVAAWRVLLRWEVTPDSTA